MNNYPILPINPSTAYNILDTRFVVSSANQVWCCDFTSMHVHLAGTPQLIRLFLILDIGTNEILFANAGPSFTAKNLVQSTLNILQNRLGEFKHTQPLIIHTDQGREFTSFAWNSIPNHLAKAFAPYKNSEGFVAISMSRRARPGDNSVIENFNRTIKNSTYLKPLIPSQDNPNPIRFTSVPDLQKYILQMQEDHNLFSKSKRSLYTTPTEAYQAFQKAANILPLPQPPIVKNIPFSTEVDNIHIYRQQALQISQQRYQPTAMEQDVVHALHLINQNIVNIGDVQREHLNNIHNKIHTMQGQVQLLVPKPTKVHVKQVLRDSFSTDFLVVIRNKLQNPLPLPHYTQRNHIAIHLLHTTGVRCNETRYLTLQQLLDLSTHHSLEIFETKTKRKRVIAMSTQAATLLRKALLHYIETLNNYLKLQVDLTQVTLWFNLRSKQTMHPKSILRTINQQLDLTLAESLGLDNVKLLRGLTPIPRISSHSGRITFVTKLLKHGTEIDTVRQMVGHSRIDTTLRYSRNMLSLSERKKILDDINEF